MDDACNRVNNPYECPEEKHVYAKKLVNDMAKEAEINTLRSVVRVFGYGRLFFPLPLFGGHRDR